MTMHPTAGQIGEGAKPAAVWWFERNGDRAGPVTPDDLRAHVMALDITPSTLVWRDGMPGWLRLDAVPELSALAGELRLAGAWPRFFARVFDVVLTFATISALLTLSVAWQIGATPLSEAIDAKWLGLFVPLLLLSQPLLDALILSVFGNTPGKALLGIHVIDARGRRPSMPRYFLRNLLVAVFGSGLFMGVIAIAALIWQYLRVSGGNPAAYDLWTKCRVLGRRVSGRQMIGFVVAAAATLVLWYAAIQLAKRLNGGHRTPVAAASKPGSGEASGSTTTTPSAAKPGISPPADTSFVWRNPVTQTAVRVDGAWIYTEANNRSGDRISLFSTDDGRAQIILGADTVSKVSLSQYAQSFVKKNSDRYTFEDSGRIVRAGTGSKWVAVARSQRHADVRLQFEVVQRGQRFWYLVVALDKPYDKHARPTDTLRETLLRSIGDGSDGAL